MRSWIVNVRRPYPTSTKRIRSQPLIFIDLKRFSRIYCGAEAFIMRCESHLCLSFVCVTAHSRKLWEDCYTLKLFSKLEGSEVSAIWWLHLYLAAWYQKPLACHDYGLNCNLSWMMMLICRRDKLFWNLPDFVSRYPLKTEFYPSYLDIFYLLICWHLKSFNSN